MKKLHDQLLRNIAKNLHDDLIVKSKDDLRKSIIQDLLKSSALPATFYRDNADGFKNLQHAFEVASNRANTKISDLHFLVDEVFNLFSGRTEKQHRVPERFYRIMVTYLDDISIAFNDHNYKQVRELLKCGYDHLMVNYSYRATHAREEEYINARPQLKKYWRDIAFHRLTLDDPSLITEDLQKEIDEFYAFRKKNRFSMSNKLIWFFSEMLIQLEQALLTEVI
jgi:hypothetical protein